MADEVDAGDLDVRGLPGRVDEGAARTAAQVEPASGRAARARGLGEGVDAEFAAVGGEVRSRFMAMFATTGDASSSASSRRRVMRRSCQRARPGA
ncbi:hypothetical protein ACFHW2_09265 [Actinomadura sp. LOL_016]|uniref:hypothetical protein n=1 Tax=unclassified Actinomadura TaxID=2626254 RepID=UPI003A803748